MKKQQHWFEIENEGETISPSLLVYPERIVENIHTMIRMVGDVERLRPHIKTHKMAEIIQLQMNLGITKFKCATIAEAELLAQCGAKDILLAMQPVGRNIHRFIELIKKYPGSKISTLVDNRSTIQELAHVAIENDCIVSVWLDINNGMNRTGIVPGDEAFALYKTISTAPGLAASGLHVYDGHFRQPDLSERKKLCDQAFDLVIQLKQKLEENKIAVSAVVAGGTPTFPIHSKRLDVEASPGTCLLWDAGYGESFKEMEFLYAAVLFISVISKPLPDLICFDLGHKSVASEMTLPRVRIIGRENCNHISQSEEHLVVTGPDVQDLQVGDVCYAIPIHICPTVAKYDHVLTVEAGKVTGSWKVAARDRKIII